MRSPCGAWLQLFVPPAAEKRTCGWVEQFTPAQDQFIWTSVGRLP
jgi:hypothetical protein